MAKAKAKTKATGKAKPAAKPKAQPSPKPTPTPVPDEAKDEAKPKDVPIGVALARAMSPRSPVKNQGVTIRGYVRDRQQQMAQMIDNIKATHGAKADRQIALLAKRIELLNPIKDLEVARIIEALFL